MSEEPQKIYMEACKPTWMPCGHTFSLTKDMDGKVEGPKCPWCRIAEQGRLMQELATEVDDWKRKHGIEVEKATALRRQEQWHPIETAPNGVEIFVAYDDGSTRLISAEENDCLWEAPYTPRAVWLVVPTDWRVPPQHPRK